MLSKLFSRCALAVCAAGLSVAAHAGPTSNSFVVNANLAGNQNLINPAVAGNGDTLYLWMDTSAGTNSFIRRYSVTGQELTAGDTYVGSRAGSIAADRVGNYAVTTTAPDGFGTGAFVTLYNRNGSVRVNTFRVNDSTTGDQIAGPMTMDANGNFAISYWSFENNIYTTYLKRYNANGTARGPATKISVTTATLNTMGMAMDTLGNVVMGGWVIQNNTPDVWMRRVSNTGVLIGSQLTVNTYTPSAQTGGHIAMLPSNAFVMVFQSYGQDGPGWSIYAQRFNADGSRNGAPFRINTGLTNYEPAAQIAAMDDGSYAVTWMVDNRDTDPTMMPYILARQFRGDDTPVGSEFQASSLPGSKAFNPTVVMDPAGNYAVTWRDYGANGYDVGSRRYVMDTLPPVQTLNNGQSVTNISGATGSWTYYKISVPAGVTSMNINMTGIGPGDADMYIRFGALPTLSKFDIRPYLTGSNESVSISNPPAGDFYIGINGYAGFSGVSLTASY
jgi:serine protease